MQRLAASDKCLLQGTALAAWLGAAMADFRDLSMAVMDDYFAALGQSEALAIAEEMLQKAATNGVGDSKTKAGLTAIGLSAGYFDSSSVDACTVEMLADNLLLHINDRPKDVSAVGLHCRLYLLRACRDRSTGTEGGDAFGRDAVGRVVPFVAGLLLDRITWDLRRQKRPFDEGELRKLWDCYVKALCNAVGAVVPPFPDAASTAEWMRSRFPIICRVMIRWPEYGSPGSTFAEQDRVQGFMDGLAIRLENNFGAEASSLARSIFHSVLADQRKQESEAALASGAAADDRIQSLMTRVWEIEQEQKMRAIAPAEGGR